MGEGRVWRCVDGHGGSQARAGRGEVSGGGVLIKNLLFLWIFVGGSIGMVLIT